MSGLACWLKREHRRAREGKLRVQHCTLGNQMSRFALVVPGTTGAFLVHKAMREAMCIKR